MSKKILILTLILSFALTGCWKKNKDTDKKNLNIAPVVQNINNNTQNNNTNTTKPLPSSLDEKEKEALEATNFPQDPYIQDNSRYGTP